MKSVLFITDSDKQLSGGLKQLYFNVIGLKKRGYNIYMVCKKASGIFDAIKEQLDSFIFLEFKDVRGDGKILLDFARRNNVDVVHTFHNKGHKVGLWGKIFGGSFRLFINRGVNFVPTNIFYYPHPKIDGFVCNSKNVADKLKYIFVPKKKRNVIYNAFSPSLDGFHEDTIKGELPEKDAVKIVTVTSGSKWKGFDISLKVLSNIQENFSFYAVGVDDYTNFEKFITTDLNKNIVRLGRRRDVLPILSRMDIFLYTPRAGDSCPNVILEAMYAGLPVIATDIGGISELIADKEGGFVVDKNIKDICSKLSFLIKNPEMIRKMGDFNRNRIKFFNLDRKVESLLKIYSGENVVEKIL